MIHILHVTAEAAPYSQTGGLGAVLGALPQAQRSLGDNVTVITPRYGFIDVAGATPESSVVQLAGREFSVTLWRRDGFVFVDVPGLLDRPHPYGYEDDPLRFGVFCKAAATIPADVVHLHDWHAGLTAMYLRGARPSIQTVHNLAYQGTAAFDWADQLEVPAILRSYDGLEFHGQLNLLKAGLTLANMITTVSPTYAKEVQSEPGGQGLAGLFQHRSDGIYGVLNGIDTDGWDPSTDSALASQFSQSQPEGRAANTAALRAEFGLQDGPIFGYVGRAAEQKGLDLLIEATPKAIEMGARFVVLADGEPDLLAALRAAQRPGAFALVDAFDLALARRIYGGADFVLVPSRFEPCGLTQMYGMRYGAVPVVRRTGGLADTVRDGVDGICFDAPTSAGLAHAIERSIQLSSTEMTQLRSAGMAHDWAWSGAAKAYREIYAKLIQGATK